MTPGDVSPRPGELRLRGLSHRRAPTPPAPHGCCPRRRPGRRRLPGTGCRGQIGAPRSCRIPPLQPRGRAPWLLPLWPGSGRLLPPGSSGGKAVRCSRISFAFSHPPRTPKWQVPPCFSFPRPDGRARAGSLPGTSREAAVGVEKLLRRSWGKSPGRLGENSKSLTPNQIPGKSCSSSRRRCGGGAGRRSFRAVRVPKLCEARLYSLRNSRRRVFQGTFSRENRNQRGQVATGVRDRGRPHTAC